MKLTDFRKNKYKIVIISIFVKIDNNLKIIKYKYSREKEWKYLTE